MEFQYADLLETGTDETELVNVCPWVDEDLHECDRFFLDRYMMSDKPWFMPFVNMSYIGGFNTIVAYRFNLDKIESWEDAKKWVEEVVEECHLKDYFVFKTCPNCGIELPAVDFRNREDGFCTFCGMKEKSIVTHEKREADPA